MREAFADFLLGVGCAVFLILLLSDFIPNRAAKNECEKDLPGSQKCKLTCVPVKITKGD